MFMSMAKSIQAILCRREILTRTIQRMLAGSNVHETELDTAINEIERAASDLYRIALHAVNVHEHAATLEKLEWPFYDDIRFPSDNSPPQLRNILEAAATKSINHKLPNITQTELARLKRKPIDIERVRTLRRMCTSEMRLSAHAVSEVVQESDNSDPTTELSYLRHLRTVVKIYLEQTKATHQESLEWSILFQAFEFPPLKVE